MQCDEGWLYASGPDHPGVSILLPFPGISNNPGGLPYNLVPDSMGFCPLKTISTNHWTQSFYESRECQALLDNLTTYVPAMSYLPAC